MTTVLEIEGLSVRIGTPRGAVMPVRGISLSIAAGESVALVGESGSGKTVTALSIMHLLPTGRSSIEADRYQVCGVDVLTASESRLRSLRGRTVSMIFQDPMHSLNPVMRIGGQVAESVRRAGVVSRSAVRARVLELLASVEVDPRRVARSYPHQLSGGMKQRVMIAMALACEPDLIIADEPTTALDVSTQAGVLDLLRRRAAESGTALLLVTHDLGVVASLADRVAVMYAGRIVETGRTADLYRTPRHPYTRGLLRSIPQLTDDRGREFPAIPGSAPDVRAIPGGCAFAPRCERRTEVCARTPVLEGPGDRAAACWHPLEREVAR